MPRYDPQLRTSLISWANDIPYGEYGEVQPPRLLRDRFNTSFFYMSASDDLHLAGDPNYSNTGAGFQTRLGMALAIRQLFGSIRSTRRFSFYLSDSEELPSSLADATHVRVDMQGGGYAFVFMDTNLRQEQLRVMHYSVSLSRPYGTWQDESPESDGSAPPEGIVFEAAPRNSNYAGTITPTPELLATLPAAAKPFAVRTIVNLGAPRVEPYFFVLSDDGEVTSGRSQTQQPIPPIGVTGAGLVAQARASYRLWLKMRWSRPEDEREIAARAAQAEHRRKSEQNFATFRGKAAVEEPLIPTLPFLPHGLAASRRWGIEIESGGCRGVSAPAGGWQRKTDGSLRSAWDGYTEVQDFEPYDEEVTTNEPWFNCVNADRHTPQEQVFDDTRGEYIFRVRADYMPVDDCPECGPRTRTVHHEPQTITHRAQRDDCGEFVSPILVSMHSNGLETLLAQIAPQPQNDTAGVHVHVESRDLNDRQIATLIYGYDLLEHLLESSYQRGRRNYCKRREQNEVLGFARSLKRNEGSISGARGGDRYVTVNTNSLSRHGTIEFRAMGPVYDYNHLIRWAMFCREMVNVVAAGATQKDFGRVKKWEDVLTLFARFGKEYVRAAVYELTGETGSQASLSKEGVAISTTAANEDLRTVVERIANMNAETEAAFRRMARPLAQARVSVEDLAARLVASDELLATV